MKKLFIITVLLIACTSYVQAQKDSLKVWGNCGMCKTRIENAAKKAGASAANWNEETKVLYVKYAAGSNNQKVQKAIAAVGHDTEQFTAPEEVYNRLHGCCKYERKAASEKTTTKSCCADMEKCKKENCCNGGTCSKNENCCVKTEKTTAKSCCTDMEKCKKENCCNGTVCNKNASCCSK